ncbi:hypothetical protein COOONC_26684 [Cooperia oncophora]
MFAVCGGPQFYQNVRQGNDDPSYLSSALCIAYFVWYAAVIIYVFLMCFADPRDPSEKRVCFFYVCMIFMSFCVLIHFSKAPLNWIARFFNRLTLWWFNPVPWKGARKDLEPDDLFQLNEGSTSKYLTELWEKHWTHRITDYYEKMRLWEDSGKEKKPALPSVVGCLFMMFRWEFLTASALKITSDTLQFANPFLLQ